MLFTATAYTMYSRRSLELHHIGARCFSTRKRTNPNEMKFVKRDFRLLNETMRLAAYFFVNESNSFCF